MTFFRKILLLVIFIGVFLLLLYTGRYPLSLQEILQINSVEFQLLFHIRLPRLIASFIIGGSLAIAGSLYQSILQNPMASPFVLGASAGAGFGAALSMVLGFSLLTTSGLAFFFSFFAVMVSSSPKKGHTITIVLQGMILSSLFSSGLSLLKLYADPLNELPSIIFWLMGSFSLISWNNILPTLIICLLCLFFIHLTSWRVNLLSLGKEQATALGVSYPKEQFLFLMLATLLTSASIAVCGIIGWIGLIIPHICRILFGVEFHKHMGKVFLTGAFSLAILDTLCRSLFLFEIPIGIMTSLIGAPCFWYILHKKGSLWQE